VCMIVVVLLFTWVRACLVVVLTVIVNDLNLLCCNFQNSIAIDITKLSLFNFLKISDQG
jgi:hypothetical protein